MDACTNQAETWYTKKIIKAHLFTHFCWNIQQRFTELRRIINVKLGQRSAMLMG